MYTGRKKELSKKTPSTPKESTKSNKSGNTTLFIYIAYYIGVAKSTPRSQPRLQKRARTEESTLDKILSFDHAIEVEDSEEEIDEVTEDKEKEGVWIKRSTPIPDLPDIADICTRTSSVGRDCKDRIHLDHPHGHPLGARQAKHHLCKD